MGTQSRVGKSEKEETFPLELERDSRLGLNVMRVPEAIILNEGDCIAVLPGNKGHGWQLKVYRASTV